MDKTVSFHRKSSPPSESYWANPSLTREQLNAQIAARRAQQRPATVSDLTNDPALAASTALAKDHRPRWKEAR